MYCLNNYSSIAVFAVLRDIGITPFCLSDRDDVGYHCGTSCFEDCYQQGRVDSGELTGRTIVEWDTVALPFTSGRGNVQEGLARVLFKHGLERCTGSVDFQLDLREGGGGDPEADLRVSSEVHELREELSTAIEV